MVSGFSVHAGVAIRAHDRKGLERLCKSHHRHDGFIFGELAGFERDAERCTIVGDGLFHVGNRDAQPQAGDVAGLRSFRRRQRSKLRYLDKMTIGFFHDHHRYSG
jgi:hypothetical protein